MTQIDPNLIRIYLSLPTQAACNMTHNIYPHAQTCTRTVSAGPGCCREVRVLARRGCLCLLLHRLQPDRDFPPAGRQHRHRRRGVLQSDHKVPWYLIFLKSNINAYLEQSRVSRTACGSCIKLYVTGDTRRLFHNKSRFLSSKQIYQKRPKIKM